MIQKILEFSPYKNERGGGIRMKERESVGLSLWSTIWVCFGHLYTGGWDRVGGRRGKVIINLLASAGWASSPAPWSEAWFPPLTQLGPKPLLPFHPGPLDTSRSSRWAPSQKSLKKKKEGEQNVLLCVSSPGIPLASWITRGPFAFLTLWVDLQSPGIGITGRLGDTASVGLRLTQF